MELILQHEKRLAEILPKAQENGEEIEIIIQNINLL
jgi:hypothetical protein